MGAVARWCASPLKLSTFAEVVSCGRYGAADCTSSGPSELSPVTRPLARRRYHRSRGSCRGLSTEPLMTRISWRR